MPMLTYKTQGMPCVYHGHRHRAISGCAVAPVLARRKGELRTRLS